MTTDRDVRVVAQEYHRNGIGGAGFIVSLVDWQLPFGGGETPTPHFVAITLPGPDGDESKMQRAVFIEQTMVLSIDQLMRGDVSGAWRGSDYVGPAVADAWVERCKARGYEAFPDPALTPDDVTPTCDICGEEWDEGGEGDDWNGETGNHYSCER